jgi:hypothetical protein
MRGERCLTFSPSAHSPHRREIGGHVYGKKTAVNHIYET